MAHQRLGERVDAAAVTLLLQAKRRDPGGEWVEVLPKVTRMGSKVHGWAAISFSSITEDDADAVIEEQIAYFGEIGQEFEWTVYGFDQPRDLLARLDRHGFVVGQKEAIMIYDLSLGLGGIVPDGEFRIERITRPTQIDQFRAVAESVFGKDYTQTSGELLAALESGSTDHLGYIAFDGDEPVSIGRLYTGADTPFAGFYGGGTLPSHRGRGFYRAMVYARAMDAVSLGSRYLRVDALPTSRPILERLGFAHLTDSWPCVHP